MTTSQHPEPTNELWQALRDGDVEWGIDPAIARRFFTDTRHDTIEARIGEPVYAEKFVVWVCFAFQFFSFFGSLVSAPFAFGWWSVLVVPLYLIVVLWFRVRVSSGYQPMFGVSLLLATAIAISLLTRWAILIRLWVIAAAATFFFARALYASSLFCLRCLVYRNRNAFNWLYQKRLILFRKHDEIWVP